MADDKSYEFRPGDGVIIRYWGEDQRGIVIDTRYSGGPEYKVKFGKNDLTEWFEQRKVRAA